MCKLMEYKDDLVDHERPKMGRRASM